jgi:hypothetical protein
MNVAQAREPKVLSLLSITIVSLKVGESSNFELSYLNCTGRCSTSSSSHIGSSLCMHFGDD